MLESASDRILLMESSHKWTPKLFMISNKKLGIWLCSQPRIDLKSQYNLYDAPTLDHTRIFPTNLPTTYLEQTPHLVPPGYDPLMQVLSNFIFLCICCQQEPIVITTHAQTFEFLRCQYQNLLPSSLTHKINF